MLHFLPCSIRFRFERVLILEIKPWQAFRQDHKRGIMIHILPKAKDGIWVVISKTLRTFVNGIQYSIPIWMESWTGQMPACNAPSHCRKRNDRQPGMRGQIRMPNSKKKEINRSVSLISDTMRLQEAAAAFMWYQRHAWKKGNFRDELW